MDKSNIGYTTSQKADKSGDLNADFLHYDQSDKYNIKPLQAVQLQILKEFDRVCRNHNLKYFLAYGTCLGAVRHQGFIPWDDDVDVIMPIDDYNKLEELYRDEFDYSYFLQSYESEPESGLTFKKLRKSDTTLLDVPLGDKKVNHGINIDIYPYYHLADGKIRQRIQYFDQIIWMLYTVEHPPKNHGKVFSIGAEALLKITPRFMRKKIRERAFKGMMKYNDVKTENFCFGHYMEGIGQKYKAEWFETAKEVPFEDGCFPIPIMAEEMLTERYGDFMKLPPEEERVAKLQDIIAWSADIPYKEYEKTMLNNIK